MNEEQNNNLKKGIQGLLFLVTFVIILAFAATVVSNAKHKKKSEKVLCNTSNGLYYPLEVQMRLQAPKHLQNPKQLRQDICHLLKPVSKKVKQRKFLIIAFLLQWSMFSHLNWEAPTKYKSKLL